MSPSSFHCSLNRLALAVLHLPRNWRRFAQLDLTQCQFHGPRRIKRSLINAVEPKCNLTSISARCNQEIMLKVHSPSVKADINTGIDVVVVDGAKVLHVHNRMVRIAAEVIAACDQRLLRSDRRTGRRLVKKHSEASLARQGDGEAVSRQEDNALTAAGQILNLWSGLSAIGLKCERRCDWGRMGILGERSGDSGEQKNNCCRKDTSGFEHTNLNRHDHFSVTGVPVWIVLLGKM